LDNPDHVAISIHNYRWRLGLADGERRYDDLEKRLAQAPVITVPTINDGRRRERRAAPGAQRLRHEVRRQVCAPRHRGRHRANCRRKAPEAFAKAVVEADGWASA